jgi:hypothetical protein
MLTSARRTPFNLLTFKPACILFPSEKTRHFSSKSFKMSDMEVELTAPNGVKYIQPLGLFIDNEFVKPKKADSKITSINPT